MITIMHTIKILVAAFAADFSAHGLKGWCVSVSADCDIFNICGVLSFSGVCEPLVGVIIDFIGLGSIAVTMIKNLCP